MHSEKAAMIIANEQLNSTTFDDKMPLAYVVLLSLVICGLAVATVTATKVVHIGINFPFSNLVFSVLTFPIIDCICELWGKGIAQRTVIIALLSQLLVALLLQLSIAVPHADYWTMQQSYQQVLASSNKVIIASLIAFFMSQLLDIAIYQKIRAKTKGRYLWLRSNTSTIIGQALDSAIFVSIVFFSLPHKMDLFLGSVMIKIILSILMTPFVYLIVGIVRRSKKKIQI
jgi:hypothetical protein